METVILFLMNEEQLKELICEKFLGGDQSFPIDLNTKLLDDGICDSLGLVQLAVEIEGRCSGLRIPDQDITRENFGSMAEMLRYLGQKQHT